MLITHRSLVRVRLPQLRKSVIVFTMTLFAYKTVWMIAMRYYRHVIPSEAGRPARDFRFSISRDSLFHFGPFGIAVMWFRRVCEESLFLPMRFFLLYSRQNDKIVISTACERAHAKCILGMRFFTPLTLCEWMLEISGLGGNYFHGRHIPDVSSGRVTQ